jgi:hypothetical protein
MGADNALSLMGDKVRELFGPKMIVGQILAEGQFAPKGHYYVGERLSGKHPFGDKRIWGTGCSPDEAIESAMRRVEHSRKQY